MAKKIVEKKKWKIKGILIVLFILIGLSFSVYFLLQIKTQNIIIKNNDYLNDDYIIDLGEVSDYPKFVLLNRRSVSQKIEKSPYIEKVKVHKKWGFLLEIDVSLKKALFFDENKNQYVFNDGSSTDIDTINRKFRLPRLINYVPDVKYEKFIENMGKVKIDTLSKISDIEYQPNDYDKDRFLLYMDDGNMVYLTLTKFKMINHYNEVVEQLENHKGILYLDNGNHFQIKE